jgi:hypothetical protein
MRELKIAAVLAAVAALSPISRPMDAHAASPSLSVTPKKILLKTGGLVVHGAHLSAGARYFILFAEPSYRPHAFVRFVGQAKSNGSGTFALHVKLPKGTHCGGATVYLQPFGSVVLIGTHVSVTGCKKIGPPPSPHKP